MFHAKTRVRIARGARERNPQGIRAVMHPGGFIHGPRGLRILAGLSLLLPLGAPGLCAQQRDFLLGTPRATLSLKAGLTLPRAGGGNGGASLWDDLRDQFTVTTAGLRGTYIAGEVGIRASERVDVVFGVGYASSATRSEYRKWTYEDDLPINQTTEFTTTPLTAGLKVYLMPRGRAVGSYAWIPRTFNVYGGIAGGIVRYRFEQYGEFVDYVTLDIFTDRLLSVETGATAHFFAGIDIGVNRRMVFTGEARYGFANAPLDGYTFRGFADLDLTGMQISGGVGFRL